MANLNNSDSDTDDVAEKAIILFTAVIAGASAATVMCNAASTIVAAVATNYMEEEDENDIRGSHNWKCLQSTNAVLDGHGMQPSTSLVFGMTNTPQAGLYYSRSQKKKKKVTTNNEMVQEMKRVTSSLKATQATLIEMKDKLSDFIDTHHAAQIDKGNFRQYIMQCLRDIPNIDEPYTWRALRYLLEHRDLALFFIELPVELRWEFLINTIPD
ncbi:uncharacterized protein LOC131227984 isoform X2 [Magnolia sinica]|uniref:uncharacterized protein LOC131227984 isoform X2 n=1 Tax=Magnolia sinica TaxID=86752 RepID=UPI00265980AB|nr:uncharacterized protein LOC131227984 isoform X2 [Magnolia sinica]